MANQREQGLVENPSRTLIEVEEGISKIENLHEHTNMEAYQKVIQIFKPYFPLEENGKFMADSGRPGHFSAAVSVGGCNFAQRGFEGVDRDCRLFKQVL